MGTRINYFIQPAQNDCVVCAVLYSNSNTVDALNIFKAKAGLSSGPNELVSRLIGIRYGGGDALKRSGQQVFSFDGFPYDHEFSVKVWWCDGVAVVSTAEDSALSARSKPLCKRCESSLRNDGFCTDRGCFHSDWPQQADIDVLSESGGEAYHKLTGIHKRVAVNAEAESDDLKGSAKFDAGPYFYHHLQNGTLANVLEALEAIDFGGNEAADDVARFFEDAETKAIFDATGENSRGEMIGFECYVSAQALRPWVEKYAPEHLPIINQTN